jgi:hypothetical protein
VVTITTAVFSTTHIIHRRHDHRLQQAKEEQEYGRLERPRANPISRSAPKPGTQPLQVVANQGILTSNHGMFSYKEKTGC